MFFILFFVSMSFKNYTKIVKKQSQQMIVQVYIYNELSKFTYLFVMKSNLTMLMVVCWIKLNLIKYLRYPAIITFRHGIIYNKEERRRRRRWKKKGEYHRLAINRDQSSNDPCPIENALIVTHHFGFWQPIELPTTATTPYNSSITPSLQGYN